MKILTELNVNIYKIHLALALLIGHTGKETQIIPDTVAISEIFFPAVLSCIHTRVGKNLNTPFEGLTDRD